MSKPLLMFSGPVTTRSGYGARSRDIVRALINMDLYEVVVNPVPWGNTPQNALVLDDPNDKMIIDKLLRDQLKQQPDIHIHCVVPNEFQPVGKYNIGITAGLETTAIPQNWIEGINRMNLVLASSNFSAEVMRSTQFKHEETGQVLKPTTPIQTLFEGIDTNIFNVTNDCSKVLADEMDKIEEDWCFLFVGHWLQGALGHDRKDVGNLVGSFMANFKKSDKVGLILKTSGATTSVIDRDDINRKVANIRRSVEGNDDLPNVYLLHADLFDSEVNDLYNHPKVKAHITFTHGEGFGRPLLEATMSEKPVIAPGWSGHTDFLNKRQSVLLEGGLDDVSQESFQQGLHVQGQKWFRVDYERAIGRMKTMKTNYRPYKLRAKKLAKNNRKHFSLSAMQTKLQSILQKNVPKFTERVDVKLPNLNVPKLEKVV